MDKTLKQIIKEKLQRLKSVPDAFLTQIEIVQKKAFTEILKLLGTIQVDENGIILKGQLNKVEAIAAQLKNSMFNGDYIVYVRQFMSEFYKQKELTKSYFSAFGSFTDKDLYEQTFKASINAAADLLNGNSVDTVLINDVKKILNSSMTTNTSYSDMILSLRNSIEGTDKAGKLYQYTNLYVRDAFAVADRSYTQIISDEIGYEWYLYSGGELETSRDFCKERHEQYYHISEIQAWADLDWKGKNPATNAGNILVLVGGYNCIHSLLPVPTEDVPPEILARIQ